ncbi:MAG: ABC transporter permease subunit [Parcubacteria group bacterium]
MLTLFFRYLRDRRIFITIFCLAAIGTMWMYIALFPSMQQQAATLNEAFKSYPEALMKAFGIESLSFDHIENFIAMEYYSIIWPLMAIFLGVSLASGALAKEVEKGTIELVLSRPISRMKVFASRYLAGIAALILFTILSTFCIIPLAAIHNVDYELANFVTIFILSLLFAWATFSVSMMLSAFFSDKAKVSMSIGGLLVLMYILTVVAALKDNLKDLQYGSFFHYYASSDALVKNILVAESVWVFTVVALVCTGVGAWKFLRRDVAV